MPSHTQDFIYNSRELFRYKKIDGSIVSIPLCYDIPSWILSAEELYNIPNGNLRAAYSEWSNIKYSFIQDNNGKYGALTGNGQSYIQLGIKFSQCNKIELVSDLKLVNMALYGTTTSNGIIQYTDGNIWLNWNTNVGPFGAQNRATTVLTPNSFSINGSSKTHTRDYRTDSNYLLIYKSNGQSSVSNNKIYMMTINDNQIVLVPFYRNGVYGLLDLIGMNFYSDITGKGFGYSMS